MEELNKLRKQIDEIDEKFLQTLAKRFRIVAKIGNLKKSFDLPPFDQKRWEKVLQERIQTGKKYRLPATLLKDIYKAIHKHSLVIEEDIKK